MADATIRSPVLCTVNYRMSAVCTPKCYIEPSPHCNVSICVRPRLPARNRVCKLAANLGRDLRVGRRTRDIEERVLLVGGEVGGVALAKGEEGLVPKHGELVRVTRALGLVRVREADEVENEGIDDLEVFALSCAEPGGVSTCVRTLYGRAYFLSTSTRMKREFGPGRASVGCLREHSGRAGRTRVVHLCQTNQRRGGV